MEQAKHQDPFAEIAFREHPGNKDEMRELSPAAYKTKYFAPGSEKAVSAADLSYDAQLALFHEELMQLREKYRPFMRNITPAAELSRKQQPCNQFQFRYYEDADARFTRVLEGEGDWETVSVPDFRGPTGEQGKWTGFYRTEFTYESLSSGKRVYLVFKGVDYKATVYLNRKCLGSHEGFFSPFEFDVTDFLQQHNTLVIEVNNDYSMMGVGGTKLDGDKMYAATGPGWNDPYSGWNHCPPGAGIYNNVYLEERHQVFVQDVFVRPNINDGFVEVWIDLMNTTNRLKENFELHLELLPKNFEEQAIGPISFQVAYAGPGINYFRYKVDFPSYRLWEPETPFLYTARVKVMLEDACEDSQDRHFGMRKFHMDEQDTPKGTLYLNNNPVLLRGANEMGHLQQCVMQNDYDQLVDDILIAKLAHMNFYRITQRPVQEEIYDYFDMLGMMHQCDLPTFGFIRRNQFVEGVRQAAEMERLIRSHPSSVIVSLINEPSRTEKRRKGHRHLHRNELEAFFVAARQAIFVENPDRVVKNADGDYNPPTREGLPDFHCYNMWYTNNGISVGKMHKGYLPPVREGWKAGCGEYGTEGLDNYELMMSRYPKEWLPSQESEPWMPNRIHGAQTYGLHGDWYTEQHTIREWIEASQKHQCLATKLMTDAWRRRADTVVSTAIHLLIDAWPSGWMKALVGADRIPKPAYFTYKACLEPVRVHLRSDRWKVYAGETIDIEAWLLNDTVKDYEKCRVIATLRDDRREYGSYEINGCLPRASSHYAGTIRFSVPPIGDRQSLHVDACLVNESGETVNRERFTFEVFAKSKPMKPEQAVYLDTESELLCSLLEVAGQPFAEEEAQAGPFVVASRDVYHRHRAAILEKVRNGATALFLLNRFDSEPWDVDDTTAVQTAKLREVYTLALQKEHPQLSGMKPDDLSYLYHLTNDRIDGISNCHLLGEGIEPMVFAYLPNSERDGKRKLPLVALKTVGKGQIVFSCIPLSGRIGFNPTLDRMFISILNGKGGDTACTCTPSLAEISKNGLN